MSKSDFQKKIYKKWQGYSFNPSIKIIKLRDKKIREYITEEGNNKKILDLGCADGFLTGPLVKNNTVYGVEIADNLCQKARKKGIKVIKADLEGGIPFGSEKFDIVIASEVLEHVVNTDLFLAECNRVLKKGGKLVLCVPNVNTLFSPIVMFLLDYPPPAAARYRSMHVRDFTLFILKVALRNNFFEIEKKKGTIMYIPYFKRFLKARSFLADLLPRLLAEEFIIKAKKIKPFNFKKEEMFIDSSSKPILKRHYDWQSSLKKNRGK